MTEAAAPSSLARPPGPPSRGLWRIGRLLVQGDRPYMIYVAFAVLLVVFSFASPWFLSVDNFLNIGRQTALVSIIAIGMTFVIIARQIDLSVGSNLALSGMAAGVGHGACRQQLARGRRGWDRHGGPRRARQRPVDDTAGDPLVSGDAGYAQRRARARPDGDQHQARDHHEHRLFRDLRRGLGGRRSGAHRLTLLAAGAGTLLLHFSIYGRRIYAAGGNPTAALYSGVDIKRVTTLAFVLTGALAGLAALVLSARAHAARPDVVQGMELDVIASVILGGCSLFGGRGFILGTVLGSLIIGTLNNGLVLLGVSSSLQLVIKGAIIVAAVAFTRR